MRSRKGRGSGRGDTPDPGRNLLLCAALVALLPSVRPAAAAEPTRAHYEAYAGGLNVLRMDADFTITAQDYRVHTVLRTAGTLSAVMRAEQDTTVQGRFVGNRPQPARFYSYGHSRGRQRVTQVDYPAGQPDIRQLIPPAEGDEREPVPPEQQRNTVDTLSAMAQLIRQVGSTGRCEGKVMTFDGRRLAELSARTAGQEVLEPTSRSSFSGPALRCDFVGRQIAGFKKDEDRQALARPRTGSAWFAPLVPGGQPVPVRVSFRTGLFGDAVMYIANKPG